MYSKARLQADDPMRQMSVDENSVPPVLDTDCLLEAATFEAAGSTSSVESVGASQNILDVVIVGAGPAGLSAAIQACRRRLSYVVVEASHDIANTLQKFTSGKWIMAEPLHLPQRSGLHFDAGSKESVLEQWQQQIQQYDLKICFQSRLKLIEGEQGQFKVRLDDGRSIVSRNVVLSMGVQGAPNRLSAQVDPQALADYFVDASFSDCRRAVVIGAGDSAVEDALAIAENASVLLLNRRQGFSRCKAANRHAIQSAIKAGKVRCISHVDVAALKQSDQGIEVHFDQKKGEDGRQRRRAIVDKVLVRIGAHSPRQTLERFGVPFGSDGHDYPQLNEYGETQIKGIFVIGALSGQSLIKQGMNQGMVCVDHLSGAKVLPTELLMLKHKLKTAGLPIKVRQLSQWIRSQTIFKDLSEATFSALLMQIQIERFVNRQVVLKPGDHCESLYLILDGELKVETPAGQQYSLARGELYGELSLLSKQANSCEVKASGDAILLKLPDSAFRKLSQQNLKAKRYIHGLFLKRSLKWLLVSNIPAQLLKLMMKQAQLESAASGDYLAQCGDEIEHVFLLVKGSVLKSGQDGETLLQGGSLLAQEDAMAGSAHTANYRCVEENTTFWRIPADVIDGFRQLNPSSVERGLMPGVGLVESPLPHQMGVVDQNRVGFFEANNLGNAGNVLVIDKNKCVGCDHCEVACASTHGGVSRLRRKAGVKLDNLHLPNACRHCKNPGCLTDCPADAIQRTPGGDVQISDACIACGNCVSNCPYNVITLAQPQSAKTGLLASIFKSQIEPEPAKAVKCDLCVNRPGGPACVQACPTGAAQRTDPAKLIQVANV